MGCEGREEGRRKRGVKERRRRRRRKGRGRDRGRGAAKRRHLPRAIRAASGPGHRPAASWRDNRTSR